LTSAAEAGVDAPEIRQAGSRARRWNPGPGGSTDAGPPVTGQVTARKAGIMTDGTSLRGRVAGAALRRYREAIGYQLEDAALVLSCDRSKISRIEAGLRGIRTGELRALLAEYGVDAGEQEILAVIAGRRAGRGWQDEYADVLPGEMRDFLALEMAASRLLVYAPQQVPALLQTQDYALSLASADPGLPAGSRDRAAEAVMLRQQGVLGRGGLEVTVVLGQAALCQAAGGAAVMGAQLGQLAAFGEDLPGVTVQVLPFSCGAHAASGAGPVTVLELAGSPSLGVVHIGGLSGGVCLEDPAAVARHAGLFRHLRAAALPPGESARLIRDTAARYRPDGEPAQLS
jgi:transcriptional regulator with XRE-family HTH domain